MRILLCLLNHSAPGDTEEIDMVYVDHELLVEVRLSRAVSSLAVI